MGPKRLLAILERTGKILNDISLARQICEVIEFEPGCPMGYEGVWMNSQELLARFVVKDSSDEHVAQNLAVAMAREEEKMLMKEIGDAIKRDRKHMTIGKMGKCFAIRQNLTAIINPEIKNEIIAWEHIAILVKDI